MSEHSAAGLGPRAQRLLRRFDRFARSARPALEQHFGSEATAIAREARSEFQRLAGEIPYRGRESDMMFGNIAGPYQILAYVLVLKGRSHPLQAIGAWVGDAVPVPASWVPRWLVRPVLRLALPLLLRRARRSARASQENPQADEFVWEIVEEPGSDLALNIQSCAVCAAYAKHDAMDAVPYVCALDDVMSDALGLGLRRTGTRALGADACDFRYEPGGEPLRLRDQYDLATGTKRPG
jgi:hypothetical protein